MTLITFPKSTEDQYLIYIDDARAGLILKVEGEYWKVVMTKWIEVFGSLEEAKFRVKEKYGA